MELIFLNDRFDIVSAPIDRYYSLQWAENYYDEGTFELHLAADLFPTVMMSEYLYNNDADEAMLIDDVQASDDGKQTLRLGGKSLDTLLRHRIMDDADSFTGTVEDIARQAVQKYAIASDRSVSLLRLGTRKGYTDTAVATNERGAVLYDWLRELLKPYEMSFRIHYDYDENALEFEVYRGLDRTQEQTENTWAIFSTSYENLSQFRYARNRTDYRNYAIVMTDDGTKRVTVDKTNGTPRRELFVSADDELDTAAMTQLGEQALAEYAMIETVGGEVQRGANMVYGTNYALGDLCNIENAELGVSAAARLTQMTTVVEGGVTRRVPGFGEQYLDLRQYVAREVRASGGGGTSSGGGGVVDLTGIERDIAENRAAIDDVRDEVEAIEAAVYENAVEIAGLDRRIGALETGGDGNELPSGYISLNFIESSGTQYIDTGFTPNQNSRYVLDFIIIDASITFCIIGARASNATRSFSIIGNTGDASGTIRDDYNVARNTNIPALKSRYFIDKNKNVTKINNQSYTFSVVTFTAPCTATIFALNSSGTPGTYSSARLFSCKIYDNETLKRDYVPCINSNGEHGLYDKVNAKFYGNAGTGSFTGG